jgi:uncharacterized membrane protein HdeD (DUF308 family)
MLQQFHKIWRVLLAVAILNILIGLVVFFPFQRSGPETIQNMVAFLLIMSSIVSGVYVFGLGKGYDKTPGIVATVLRLATALIIIFDPLDTWITFTVLIAIFFGIDGALVTTEAQKFRRLKQLYFTMMVNGITGIIFCILIFRFQSGAPYARVSAFIAITFWIRGAVGIHTALLARAAKPLEEVATPEASPAPPPNPPQG